MGSYTVDYACPSIDRSLQEVDNVKSLIEEVIGFLNTIKCDSKAEEQALNMQSAFDELELFDLEDVRHIASELRGGWELAEEENESLQEQVDDYEERIHDLENEVEELKNLAENEVEI